MRQAPARIGESLVVPPSLTARWAAQMMADYDKLPEEMKDSDRKEADRFIEAFSRHFPPTEAAQVAVEAHDLEWALRELADGWITNNEREGPHGFYQNVRRVLESVIADATDAGEVERLRKIVREQRKTIKHWQHHVTVTSRLLGCNAIDKDVEAAVDELRHELEDRQIKLGQLRAELFAARERLTADRDSWRRIAERLENEKLTARADAVRACAKELRRRAGHAESTGNHLPGTDQAMCLHAEARALAQAATWLLESLAKGEGDDGPTTTDVG